MIRSSLIFAWLLLWVFSCNTSADEVTIVHNGSHLELEGEILIETQNDNGLLFQSRDGKLWVVEQEQLKAVSYTHLRAPRDKRQSRMPSSA